MFGDEQRYLFDLQGCVTVPDALDAAQVADVNAEFDRRVEAVVPPDANTWRFGDVLDWFVLPETWQELDVDPPPPFVTPVTGPAGTAAIFTEALSPGTLRWRGAGERRTVFMKDNPHPIAWSARFYDRDRHPGLRERQRAILEPPNARYGGRPTA